MSKALITEGYLTDIADAIRAKNGSSATYTPAQMASAIAGIGITPEPLSVTQNGLYTAPTGKAYTPVTVNVQPSLQGKTAIQNGVITPDQGYYGLSSVVVDLPIITPEAALSGTMTQNENGINFSERSVNNNRGTIKGVEYSAGFEGFNVKFSNLLTGKTYICVFSWQTISGEYFDGTWMYGFKIANNPVTSYDVRYGVSGWTPMRRDTDKHSYAITFTPSGSTVYSLAYLAFALPGYSDDTQNSFELTGLMVLDSAKLI